MVCGKNTVVKKAIDIRLQAPKEDEQDYEFRKPLYTKLPQIEKILALCKGKVGFIFSDAPVFELKPLIESNRIPAAAKVGIIAPLEVSIPAGPTGLDPSQISFFHTLNISTKIQKGQIEITKEFKVVEKGKKILNSEAAILQKLNIKPFSFGMEILYVYDDGAILSPEVFNLNPEELLGRIRGAASKIAAISLAIGQPNILSVPHMIINGFKKIASAALETNIPIKILENLKKAGPATTTAPTQVKPEVVKPVVEEKKEEPEEVDMGNMFGDDEDY